MKLLNHCTIYRGRTLLCIFTFRPLSWYRTTSCHQSLSKTRLTVKRFVSRQLPKRRHQFSALNATFDQKWKYKSWKETQPKTDDWAAAIRERKITFYLKKKKKMHCFLSTQRAEKFGLYNHGATCYLNSVLQVLFMTEDFRVAVERCVKRKHSKIPVNYLKLKTIC